MGLRFFLTLALCSVLLMVAVLRIARKVGQRLSWSQVWGRLTGDSGAGAGAPGKALAAAAGAPGAKSDIASMVVSSESSWDGFYAQQTCALDRLRVYATRSGEYLTGDQLRSSGVEEGEDEALPATYLVFSGNGRRLADPLRVDMLPRGTNLDVRDFLPENLLIQAMDFIAVQLVTKRREEEEEEDLDDEDEQPPARRDYMIGFELVPLRQASLGSAASAGPAPAT